MSLETPIWLQGGTYSARQDRSLLDVIFTEGVIDPGGSALLVAERAAGANDTVDVAAGAAIITGDDEADQGKYYVRNTAVVNVAFTPAPGTDERIDLLVLQVNDPTAGGAAGDNAVFEVVTGTVAGTAVPPAVPDTAIPLAEVLRLSTDTTIVNARITDRRVGAILEVPADVTSLDDIGDINITTPTDGDLIQFDSASGDWVNVAVPDLGDLSDVDLTSVADDDIIQFDSGSGNWLAAALPAAKVVDFASGTDTTGASSTTFVDTASVSFTPKDASNILLIEASGLIQGGYDSGPAITGRSYNFAIRDATAGTDVVVGTNGRVLVAASTVVAFSQDVAYIRAVVTAGSTTARTYQLRCNGGSGLYVFALGSATTPITITVTEFTP